MEATRRAVNAAHLERYLTVGDWLDAHGGAFFATRSSVDWFIKMHRVELVKRGALITREGRNSSLVERDKFAREVVRIFTRRATEKIERSPAHARA